jgi:peptide/nickel transport system substrate-binding protein
MGMFAPSHYLKKYHPKYAGQEAVDKIAKAEGYDNWVNLFKFKNTWSLDPEAPTIAPWVTVTPINTDTWKLERNPYFWIIDSEGNQLPYIDTVILTQAEDLEVINLRSIAGEYDYQARHMNLAKVPVFLQNAEKGKYSLAFDPADAGCDACVKFNMSYTEDPEVGKWLANREFRRALGLGIQRDQINEVFFLGLGTAGSIAPRADNLYSPGPDSEWRNKWATFDPELANKMLDDMGLDKKDSDGYRLRTDNGERLVLEISGRVAQFIEFVQIGEMVSEHWAKNLGIKSNTTGLERSLAQELARAGKTQIRVSWGDATVKLFASCGQVFPCNGNSEYGKDLGLWYMTEGEKGTEPDAVLKDLMKKYKSAFGLTEDQRIALGKEIWRTLVDEVYAIGTVGLSPAAMGVRMYKNDLGNLPAKQFNSPVVKTPGISRPATFYWKSPENRERQSLSYE